MIRAEAVSVRLGGRPLLDGVTLALEAGKVMAVVGPNGAGKSTLLRILAGELRPGGGRMTVAGRDLREWSARELARRRAVVSQKVALTFPMTAAEVVALGRLPWRGTEQAARDDDAVREGLRAARVGHLALRAYATLSGGEQQRVQVARALAQLDGAAAPAALLLDEPTASLDAAHRATLLHLLRQLAERGLAVLVVLHDLNEADFVADQVAVLMDGRCQALGSPAEVLRPDRLAAVYGVPFRRVPGGGLLPDLRSAAPSSDVVP
jgi:iron complex transport system ATP-binding protein